MAPLTRPQKPRRSALIQQQEPTLEDTLEQQILQELQKVSRGQDSLKGQVRDLRMSLMGNGDEGETEHGRLPIAESEIKEIKSDVKMLKEAHVRYGVYGKFITAGSAAIAAGVGIAIEAIYHSLTGK